jgi:MFS family permease
MRSLHVLVGLTAGLAGFCLFLVEPMMGKYILPWFGGSASTWTVCLLFFQAALLCGYFYAYAVSARLPLKVQVLLQLAILAAAVLALPIEPAEAWKPLDASAPVQRILGTLSASVGLPYVVLATTSPLLQRWVSLIEPDWQVTRYFAVSNLGSFLGLLSYPFLVEPIASSPQQAIGWSWAFGVYALCFAGCAAGIWLMARRARRGAAAQSPSPRSAWSRASPEAAIWIGWATGGSVLLLATTNLISEWISVVPFLWIVPLALYLLTFVLVFSSAGYYRREIYLPLFVVLAIGTLFIGKPLSSELLLTQIVLLSAAMFAGCLSPARLLPGDRLRGLSRRCPGDFSRARTAAGHLGIPSCNVGDRRLRHPGRATPAGRAGAPVAETGVLRNRGDLRPAVHRLHCGRGGARQFHRLAEAEFLRSG